MYTLSDSIGFYMKDIGNIPLVNTQEEVELATSIRDGSEEAGLRLIISNLRLAVKIAYDFKSLGLPPEDLIYEGNIGLMRTVEEFDPQKGAKFSNCTVWWIKQAMRRTLLEKVSPSVYRLLPLAKLIR